MRIAIVHDWLNGMRGGEKVLEALVELLPNATIFTLFHQPGRVSPLIESRPIVTSWLNRVPGIYRFYRNFLPLFPNAIESMDVTGYELVISSSHAVAKGIRAGKARHICYCHTPMRYIWDAEEDYRMSRLTRFVFRAARAKLRKWDRETAGGVDGFVANSHFVQERIRRYYERESVVVPPPIDTDFFTPAAAITREDFYLSAGALVPYKRVDVIVRSFNRLGKRLIVAGGGPELRNLRAIAAANVDVRGWVSNEELRRLYRSAKALVYCAREDFGIVAVEAQSCGCPVIAYGAGGLKEIIRDGANGLLFAGQRETDVINAIERSEKMTWLLERITEGVEGFSREAFKSKIKSILESYVPELAHDFAAQTA